jgi:hypothetical protein
MNDPENNTRRGFLQILGLGAAGAAFLATGEETHGQSPERESRREPPRRAFKGTSRTGDVEEALANAIAAAQRSVRHPDAMVEWTLKSISGRSGGIAGFREVTISIEARVA